MDADKKRIWIRGQYVEVTDEVYMAYTQGDRKMRYLAGHESSKITLDIYAKVKYNRPDELADILRGAFAQWDAAQ